MLIQVYLLQDHHKMYVFEINEDNEKKNFQIKENNCTISNCLNMVFCIIEQRIKYTKRIIDEVRINSNN